MAAKNYLAEKKFFIKNFFRNSEQIHIYIEMSLFVFKRAEICLESIKRSNILK